MQKIDVREELAAIRDININIKSLNHNIEALTAIAEGGNVKYAEKVQNSKFKSTENIICSIADAKGHIYELLIQKLEKVITVNILISKLNDNILEALLRERYIECRNWADIAEIIGYDERYTHKLHNKAIKKLEGTLNRQSKTVE